MKAAARHYLEVRTIEYTVEELGRDEGSISLFLAVQWVTRKISVFLSHLPAARRRCDQMVFYYNRWEQKKKIHLDIFLMD